MGRDGHTRTAQLAWICSGLVLLVAVAAWRAGLPSRSLPEGRPALAERPALGAFSGAIGASAQAGAVQTTQRSGHVAEIRFGVIEPPVVAQRDITVRAAASNQQLEPKPLECSGMAWADGQLVITSDRHGHAVFLCPVELETMTIGLPQPQVVIRNEQELLDDAESLTVKTRNDGKLAAYAMCSLSNDLTELPLPKRRHMVRFSIDALEPFSAGLPVVFNASPIREALSAHFRAIGVQPYRTYHAEFTGPEKNTYRWGNVEGVAFTPDGHHLLCGMRNPLFGGEALMFVVGNVDEAFDAQDPNRLALTDLFTLDLGQRGVSDLCWDSLTRGYLISAAKSNGPKLDKDQPFPPNSLDSALFWWSGRKSEKPILFATVPDMKIEAICRLGPGPNAGGEAAQDLDRGGSRLELRGGGGLSNRFIAIGSDEGDVSEGREGRQSVLTILEFTGIPAGP